VTSRTGKAGLCPSRAILAGGHSEKVQPSPVANGCASNGSRTTLGQRADPGQARLSSPPSAFAAAKSRHQLCSSRTAQTKVRNVIGDASFSSRHMRLLEHRLRGRVSLARWRYRGALPQANLREKALLDFALTSCQMDTV
jgi:hypothetical protein